MCLFSTVATAEISRVSPGSFTPNGEDYITIFGSNLLGSVGTQIVFDDQFTVAEPNYVESNLIISWIPIVVLMTEGTHTVKVVSIDANGTRVHGPATFTVNLPQPEGEPTLFVPEAGIIAEATSSEGTKVEFEVRAFSANGNDLTPTCLPASGSQFSMGATRTTCTATDAGGTTQASFVVFVTDTTLPIVTVPEDIVTEDPIVTFTATAFDAIDGTLPVSCSPASGSRFTSGKTVVRCTAIDAHLNPGWAEFSVRVTGGPPDLTVPSDILAEATGPDGAEVEFEATSEEGVVSCSPASGDTFPLGTTLVSCTATSTGGQSTATFNVKVEDTSGPVITTPIELQVEAESATGGVATWVATADDLVDGDRPVDCAPPSGSFFNFGETSVLCTSVDTRNNESTTTFNVIVGDTTAPELTTLTASPGTLWPPNHQMVAVTITAVAVDAVDPAPQVAIYSVHSNQPINGTGDGDTAPDWQITGPLTLNLRAERAGSADRIYTIVVRTTDSNGNVGDGVVSVRVLGSKSRSSR